jgi:hypothetical protein
LAFFLPTVLSVRLPLAGDSSIANFVAPAVPGEGVASGSLAVGTARAASGGVAVGTEAAVG